MSLLQQAPRFTSDDAARLARDFYGLEAAAAPLPSERDQNFLLTTAAGARFVFKIANATEARANLDAQNAAMTHVAARTSVCPRVIPTKSGETIGAIPGTPHLVRLLTHLPGAPLAHVSPRSPALFEDLGRRTGEIDAALSNFDHPAIHRDFHWDLARAGRVIDEYASLIAAQDLRGLVRDLGTRALAAVESCQSRLRRSAIHNDVNDWNVLVEGDRVVGIIDFGDIVASWTVADPAVAIAYVVLDAPDPLSIAADVLRGYVGAHALRAEEIRALYPLVCLRLCLSACIAAWQLQQRPGDEYLAVSQGPIRRTLPLLATIDFPCRMTR